MKGAPAPHVHLFKVYRKERQYLTQVYALIFSRIFQKLIKAGKDPWEYSRTMFGKEAQGRFAQRFRAGTTLASGYTHHRREGADRGRSSFRGRGGHSSSHAREPEPEIEYRDTETTTQLMDTLRAIPNRIEEVELRSGPSCQFADTEYFTCLHEDSKTVPWAQDRAWPNSKVEDEEKAAKSWMEVIRDKCEKMKVSDS